MAKKKKYIRVLTNSERSTFACQKKWAYSYLEGLTEYDTPSPLKHGSLVHEMLAYWYRSNMTCSIDEIESEVGVPWLQQREEFYPHIRGDVDEKKIEDKEIYDLAIGMVDRHNKEHGDEDREDLEIIAVEASVACYIKHPVSGRKLSDAFMIDGVRHRRSYVYGGQVDLVYRRRSIQAYGYMEHKNTGDANLDNHVAKKVLFDPQTRGYTLGARYAIKGLADIEPLKIEEVTYNILRKSLPRNPKLLAPKTAEQKRTGTPNGVSKAKCDTTPEMYEAFVRANGFDVEEYRDFFERLNHQYFKRTSFSIGDIELANLQKDLYHWALQVREASKENAHHPRQTAVCLGAGAYRCPYQGLCMEDAQEFRDSFNIKQVRHAELPGDLAEPWVGAQRAPRKETKQLVQFKRPGILTYNDPLAITDTPDEDDGFAW